MTLRFLTVFLLLAVFAGNALASGAASTQDQYLVENIAVDVEGENAIEAREKALTKARRDAFDVLAGRLLEEEEKASLGSIDDQTIASLVNDFEINREKLSSNRYLASVNVRFNQRAVQSYLGRYLAAPQPDYGYGGTYGGYDDPYGDSYNDSYRVQEPVTASGDVGLVLPWYGEGESAALWREPNPWFAAWKQWTQTDQARDMRLITPIGDITDMQLFNPGKPLNYDQSALIRLLERYGAGYAVIAMADPLPNGMIRIGLYQSTTGMPRFIDNIVTPTGTMRGAAGFFPAIWQSAARAKAAARSNTAVYGEGRTASGRGGDITPFARDHTVLVPYEAEIALSGIQEWVGIKQALSITPGIQDMEIKSLSAGKAVIGFRYAGDPEALRAALNRKGMNIYRNPVLTPGKVPYIIVGSN